MPQDRPWHAYWPEDVPKDIDLPEATLPSKLQAVVRDHGDERALLTQEDSYTYDELWESITAVGGFVDGETDPKETVALYMSNHPEFVCTLYGAWVSETPVALVDPSTQGQDLEYELEASNASVVVTEGDVAEDLETLVEDFDQTVVNIDGEADTMSFDEVLASEPVEEVSVEPSDDSLVFFYAGVAERSQPLYHTHNSILASERIVSAFKRLDEDCFGLLTAPMSHGLGLFSTLQSLHNGGTIAMTPRFDVDLAVEYLATEPITFIEGGPPVYKQLDDHDEFDSTVADSLEWCLSGGAPLPEDVYERFSETADVPLLQLYGLTEAPNVAMTPFKEPRRLSMGIPLPNTDIKIVNSDDWSDEKGVGEQGELLVDTPSAMRGYESDADTADVMRDGWLATGDIVEIDENGFLHFRGTRKRIINYKGYPVLPRDIEDVLSEHPAVAECRVEPDEAQEEDVGQIPVASVVTTEDVSTEELMDYVNERVSAYKKVRRLDFVDTLE